MGPLPMLGTAQADCTVLVKFWVAAPPVENVIGPLLSTGPLISNAPLPLSERPELPQPPRVSRAGPGVLVSSPTAVACSTRLVPPPKIAEKKLGAVAITVPRAAQGRSCRSSRWLRSSHW